MVKKCVLEFMRKFPLTIAWRVKKHIKVIEEHIGVDEKLFFAFLGQKTDNYFNIFSTTIVAFTNKKIIIGTKRIFPGYRVSIITPDLFNDMAVNSLLIWGAVVLDTVKEEVIIQKIDKKALPILSDYIISYINKYGKTKKLED